ncbi:MAG: secretin and TonB N-terminal domain-containing protein [Candidatus Cloacimonetes bacterium]|nr:secretin and TonB N-terminal domain-containing protein [Candidatus Cloacimonadota bacterium]
MRKLSKFVLIALCFCYMHMLYSEQKKPDLEKFKKKVAKSDSLKVDDEDDLNKFILKNRELKLRQKAIRDSIAKMKKKSVKDSLFHTDQSFFDSDSVYSDSLRINLSKSKTINQPSASFDINSVNNDSLRINLNDREKKETTNISWKDSLIYEELSLIPETIITQINVKNADLKDLLRGLSYEYKLNLVVDNEIVKSVTLSLHNVKVIDFLFYICDEFKLKIKQHGSVLKIIPIAEPSKNIVNIRNNQLFIDVNNIAINDFINLFSEKTNRNVILNRAINISLSGRVTNLDMEKGLRVFLESNGLMLFVKDDIFYVDKKISSGDMKGDFGSQGSSWINVRDSLISFDLINVPIINVINEIIHQSGNNLITYGAPAGSISAKVSNITIDQALNYLLKGNEFTYRKENKIYILGNKNINGIITTRLFKLKHIKVDGIETMLPDFIKKGVTVNVIKEQNGILVVGTNDIIAEIEGFLTQIDQPTPQILIEALVVDYNLNSLKDIGVRMGTKYSSSDSTSWINHSFLDVGINSDGKFYTQQDAPSLNKSLDKITDWMGVKKIGNLPEQFYVQLQALEQEGKANIKSKPQIATLNGHTAKISIGTTQYYILKSTTPIKSTTDVVTQETERFEKVEANVTLSITPWVSSSGEVTVEVKPEFLTPVGNFDSKTPPTINSRILESTVRLKDGETIILGGLIEEKDNKIIRKVPILGDIPLLGKLFRTNYTNKSKTELMIYVTPHVFYGDEQEPIKWKELSEKYPYDN